MIPNGRLRSLKLDVTTPLRNDGVGVVIPNGRLRSLKLPFGVSVTRASSVVIPNGRLRSLKLDSVHGRIGFEPVVVIPNGRLRSLKRRRHHGRVEQDVGL